MKKIFYIITAFIVLTSTVYAYWRNDFDKPIQVCANHILVSSEDQANRIKSEINNFDDFVEYAKIYSDCPSGKNGGNLGCFGRKQMVKEFEQAAFDGKIGEVTGPVKTQFGYHLIWVTRKY